MKKILLLSILFLSSLAVYSQTRPGKLLIDMETGLSFNSYTENYSYEGSDLYGDISTSQFNFTPSIGVFLTENIALGGMFYYQQISQDYDGETNATSNTEVGPWVRFYFGQSKFKLFLHGNITAASRFEDYEGSDYDYKFNGLGYGVGFGASYFINEHIAATGMFKYSGVSLSCTDDKDYEYKRSGLSLNLGFSILF
jgi:hypothetical protein